MRLINKSRLSRRSPNAPSSAQSGVTAAQQLQMGKCTWFEPHHATGMCMSHVREHKGGDSFDSRRKFSNGGG